MFKINMCGSRVDKTTAELHYHNLAWVCQKLYKLLSSPTDLIGALPISHRGEGTSDKSCSSQNALYFLQNNRSYRLK